MLDFDADDKRVSFQIRPGHFGGLSPFPDSLASRDDEECHLIPAAGFGRQYVIA